MKTALLLLTVFLSGCIITNTPGFYSGYKKLPQQEKEQVVFTKQGDAICKISNDKRIYAISGSQLLDCLKDNDTSVVYLWSPHCHSEVCITMSTAQYICEKKGYKLYVVADYYDFEMMTPQNTRTSPVYAINAHYYKTDFCNRYRKLFVKDLAGGTLNKEDRFCRFYFFRKNKMLYGKFSLVEATK